MQWYKDDKLPIYCHGSWALTESHDMVDLFVLIPLFCFRARPPRTLNSSALGGPAFFLFLPHASISWDSPPIDLYWTGPSSIVQVYPAGELDKALEDLKAGKVRQTWPLPEMWDPLTISIGHQAHSGVGWFVVMVETILYSFPRHDDYMDGSNIDIFHR